jgi:DNA-binding MarR family transcriptional regulator
LTGPQFAVLTMVDSAPGRDQRSMASAVSLDASTMTDIVKRLEKRGLITRCTSTTDGRRKLLFLTDEGKDVLREANRLARALDEKLVGPYSPDQRAQLMQMLTDLADHWENLNKEP